MQNAMPDLSVIARFCWEAVGLLSDHHDRVGGPTTTSG